MKTSKSAYLDVALYLVVFLLAQFVVSLVMGFISQTASTSPTTMCIASLIASLLTIAVFAWRKWACLNGKYINTRPWFTLFWVACLSVGSIIPLELVMEQTGMEMPKDFTEMFRKMMGNEWGFMAIGVIGPVAEEIVFRGAILRRLLDAGGHRWRWAAIAGSAALFGVVHFNMVQGVNAFFVGLLLGWMYMRTRSIVPGVAFHIVNNCTAVVFSRLFPGADDMKLIDFYGGDMKRVAIAVACSLMIFLAALYQLRWRLERAD